MRSPAKVQSSSRLRFFGSADVDPAAAAVEVDFAVGEGKQRVVAAVADVTAGVPLGAALADQDFSRDHGFAAELLDAQTLCVRVASVAARALSFLVSHVPPISKPRARGLVKRKQV